MAPNVALNPNHIKLQTLFNKHRKLTLKDKHNARISNIIASESQKLRESATILKTTESGYIDSQDKIIYYDDIASNLTKGITDRLFHLKLSQGPYRVKYSFNGRHLLMSGNKGEVTMIDTHTLKHLCHFDTQSKNHDVTFFHNHTLFACAQSKYIHVYDSTGIEVHCIRDTMLSYRLEFLPYHLLLVSIGEFGQLTYQDISTGKVACRYNTKKGTCDVLCSNDKNAVVHLGHRNGTVSLWTPNLGKPVVEYVGHRGQITAIDTYDEHYIITTGMDGLWKIFDLRKQQHIFTKPVVGSITPKSLSVSQRGVVGLAVGPRLEFYNDVFDKFTNVKPFLKITADGDLIEHFSFQPFEDICCYGSKYAVRAIAVPGSGESDIDVFYGNPYETKKQQKEHEVHQLLEKLPASTISLNTNIIGTIQEQADSNNKITVETDLIDPNIPTTTKKRKAHNRKRTLSKLKSKRYNKTFEKRKEAMERKLNEILNKNPVDTEKLKNEVIVKELFGETFDDITKGSVKGAALSRYYKKKR